MCANATMHKTHNTPHKINCCEIKINFKKMYEELTGGTTCRKHMKNTSPITNILQFNPKPLVEKGPTIFVLISALLSVIKYIHIIK